MLIARIKRLGSGQFIRNVGWLGCAELVNRVFRLGTTVTLARMFTPADYGLMSIIYMTLEFANVFTLRGGIGSKIIQADEQEVQSIAVTAYWLNWMLCIFVFSLQCIAAFPIARFYHSQQLVLLLCVSALTYLFLPLYSINLAFLERENRLKITAVCNAVGSLLTNTITVILALLGLGIWAIVWAMFISTPVWIFITWFNHSWRPPKSFKLKHWREVLGFGGNLLGVDILGRVRANIDYLIVGKFLGIEELGLYYFAFNAGLGISLNVMNSFSSAIFPYLCEVRCDIDKLRERFFSSLKKTCAVIIPMILLQATLAPLYVPIIFGEKWVPAIPILIIICLSALTFPPSYFVTHLLNAIGEIRINLYWAIFNTIIFAIFVTIAIQWGILGVALSVLIYRIISLIFNAWAIKYVFGK